MTMRADDLAEVFVSRIPGLSAMKLQKLLYYTHAWHLAVTDRPLVDEQFLGYTKGPVVVSVHRARKDMSTRRQSTRPAPRLDPTAEALVDMVINEYGGRSGDELSELTHVEQPWISSRRGLMPDDPGRVPIPDAEIARFYRDHRMLGGRSAAELAAGGVYPTQSRHAAKFDIAAILAELPTPGDDLGAFSANLVEAPTRGVTVEMNRRLAWEDDPAC